MAQCKNDVQLTAHTIANIRVMEGIYHTMTNTLGENIPLPDNAPLPDFGQHGRQVKDLTFDRKSLGMPIHTFCNLRMWNRLHEQLCNPMSCSLQNALIGSYSYLAKFTNES